MNYSIENDELLLMFEVEELLCNIKKLLNNDIEDVYVSECIEPDLNFVFHPIVDLKKEQNCLYFRNDCRYIDITMDLVISFWNDGLTDNRLYLSWGRNDLEHLKTYLQLITHKTDITDPKVSNLIKLGILSETD